MNNKNEKKISLKEFLKKYHIFTTLVIIGIYLLLVVVLYFILNATDPGENGNIKYSFIDVFLFNFLTVAGNDYVYVETIPGKIIGILLLLFSMFGFSAITGYLSSAFVERKLSTKRGLKKMQNLKNHIIICGWKSDIKVLIKAILRKNKNLTSESIILINNQEDNKNELLKEDNELKDLNILKGDFTEEQTLLNANAKKASKVLILGESQEGIDDELIDSRVFVSVLMFRNLNPLCHICAEVKTERYKKYLEAQNCAEVIYTEEYTRYILSTSTNYSGMSKVMSSFLDNGDGNAVQIDPIEEKWYGKTYKELFDYYKKEMGILVIGILENMGVERELKHQILSEAQKSTNYASIIQKLKTVKDLEMNYPHLNPDDDTIITKNMGAIVIGKEIA